MFISEMKDAIAKQNFQKPQILNITGSYFQIHTSNIHWIL